MNKIIANLFVFINEVLSVIIILGVIVAGVMIGKYSDNALLGLGVSAGGSLFTILLFGFAAIMIENHKILKEISSKLDGN